MRVILAALMLCVSSAAAYADTKTDTPGQERYRTMPPPPIPPPPPPEPVFERIMPDPPIVSRPAPPERKARQAPRKTPPRKTVRRPPPKKRADPCEAKCASALEAKDKRIAELENELKNLRAQAPSAPNPFFPPGNTSGAAPPPPPSDCCDKVSQIASTNERLLGENADMRNTLWWHKWIGIGAIVILLLLILLASSRKGDRIFMRR